jgi:hypothetical protein
VQVAEFCREVETYLCRKNDGHLIRVTGPSFDLVASWAEQGVPLNVAFAGIDRYFDRYYRNGPRRRPVRIDFCEADVLDAFDEWRRATGLSQSSVESHQSSVESHQPSGGSRQSLPAHLERVVMRLTSARAADALGAEFDELIDRVARELDAVRGEARGARGEKRRHIVDRLAALDRELLAQARAGLGDAARADLGREADAELAPFRTGMTAEAFARAREAAIDRLVRRRCRLPTIALG